MLDTNSLAGLGPFFAVRTHTVGPGRPWRAMSTLVDDPSAVDSRVEQVRHALAASGGGAPASVELRVAASVAQFGVVARLAAPLLGAVVLGAGAVPELRELYWQQTLGGPYPLSVPALHEATDPSKDPDVLSPLTAVTAAFAARTALAQQALWGNLASAVNSATDLMIRARPELAQRAERLRHSVLDHPRLRAEHRVVNATFRRRSCCLIYRIAPGAERAVCGDCALLPG